MTRIDLSDPQRDVVYAAEDSTNLHRTSLAFKRIADASDYAYGVIGNEGSSVELTGVHRNGQAHRSYCATSARTKRSSIHLSRNHLNAYIVLHEVAHALTPNVRESHGPEFCGMLLHLVRVNLGFHAYGALKSAFEHFQVRYCVPNTQGVN